MPSVKYCERGVLLLSSAMPYWLGEISGSTPEYLVQVQRLLSVR